MDPTISCAGSYFGHPLSMCGYLSFYALQASKLHKKLGEACLPGEPSANISEEACQALEEFVWAADRLHYHLTGQSLTVLILACPQLPVKCITMLFPRLLFLQTSGAIKTLPPGRTSKAKHTPQPGCPKTYLAQDKEGDQWHHGRATDLEVLNEAV